MPSGATLNIKDASTRQAVDDINEVVDKIKGAIGYHDYSAHIDEFVDLDLPSGTLWAKCNIGAENPEDTGLYFAWGETVGYADATSGKTFNWSSYKYGTSDNLTKYNATDGKMELDLEDDAAYVNTEGVQKMPTQAQIRELFNDTNHTWTTVNGVNGRRFSSKQDSSKYIFIPASGYCYGSSVSDVGSGGYLWSSSRYSNPASAYYLHFDSGYARVYYLSRSIGRAVRGVFVGNQFLTSDKADKVQNASNGNFPTLDAYGNLQDSGKKPEDFATSSALNTVQNNLNTVANRIPSTITFQEDGIYQIKDDQTYPASHPDLSTQPSILPQRYGNQDIKEVLIAYGREDEIPQKAIIVQAFSFNEDCCIAAICEKGTNGWQISNTKGITPDFTLIQYVELNEGYYYYAEQFTIDDTDTAEGDVVDLGLPSGTKWAKSNIGASKPSDFGLYFQWGDTQGYADTSSKAFNWSSYKYGTSSNLTKYNSTDGKTVLDTSDDAAYTATSGRLKMPTQAQIQELVNNTDREWGTLPNGVSGCKFINKSDSSKYIFIPASGCCNSSSVYDVGSLGCLWSSSRTSDPTGAFLLYFYSGYAYVSGLSRYVGRTVRGVFVETN